MFLSKLPVVFCGLLALSAFLSSVQSRSVFVPRSIEDDDDFNEGSIEILKNIFKGNEGSYEILKNIFKDDSEDSDESDVPIMNLRYTDYGISKRDIRPDDISNYDYSSEIDMKEKIPDFVEDEAPPVPDEPEEKDEDDGLKEVKDEVDVGKSAEVDEKKSSEEIVDKKPDSSEEIVDKKPDSSEEILDKKDSDKKVKDYYVPPYEPDYTEEDRKHVKYPSYHDFGHPPPKPSWWQRVKQSFIKRFSW